MQQLGDCSRLGSALLPHLHSVIAEGSSFADQNGLLAHGVSDIGGKRFSPSVVSVDEN